MSEKTWNTEKNIWELDGVPVTYRVTWKNVDDDDEHTMEFTDVDQGYDFHKRKQNSAHSYDETWEHLPY